MKACADEAALLRSRELRAALAAEGLDVAEIVGPVAEDPATECERLEAIAAWVEAWRRHRGDRAAMQAAGYLFPPV